MPASEARVSDPADAFLGSRTTLRPAHAVAALLQLSDGRYVMQLRDFNPDIFYPEHWGCFGGAVDPGEAPAAALVRELEEELAVRVVPSAVTRFTEFTFDFGFAGDGVRLRTYYAVTLPQADLDGLVLGEGADLAAFAAESLLGCPVWSRTTLSRCGCTMRVDGLHRPVGWRGMRARMVLFQRERAGSTGELVRSRSRRVFPARKAPERMLSE